MQLDKTHIPIRERDAFDLLDLSLHVGRQFGAPLAVCFAVGIAPLAVANHLLLGGVDPWPADAAWRVAAKASPLSLRPSQGPDPGRRAEPADATRAAAG